MELDNLKTLWKEQELPPVDDRHDAAHHHRELLQPVLVELLGLQRHVGGAEIDRLGGDLLDTTTRADRLVVHARSGLGLVRLGPFGIDRVGEGRAGAGNLGGASGPVTPNEAPDAAMTAASSAVRKIATVYSVFWKILGRLPLAAPGFYPGGDTPVRQFCYRSMTAWTASAEER